MGLGFYLSYCYITRLLSKMSPLKGFRSAAKHDILCLSFHCSLFICGAQRPAFWTSCRLSAFKRYQRLMQAVRSSNCFFGALASDLAQAVERSGTALTKSYTYIPIELRDSSQFKPNRSLAAQGVRGCPVIHKQHNNKKCPHLK